MIALDILAHLLAGHADDQAWEVLETAEKSSASEVNALKIVRAFCQELGAAPEPVLRQVAAGIEADSQAADERAVALAGPKATAYLLAALPPLVVLLCSLAGMRILPVYFDGSIGTAAAIAGIAIYTIGIIWIRSLLEKAARMQIQPPDAALFAELVAAGVRCGLDIPTTLEGAGKAFKVEKLIQIATELREAIPWESATATWPGEQIEAARVMEIIGSSWRDAIAPEALLVHAAIVIRGERSRAARTVAAQLGVKLTLPLGLCLLPAFILLLIVPLVVSGVVGVGG